MLTKTSLHDYWNNRAAKQGRRTVGFKNRPLDIQNSRYNERIDFIFSRCACPTSLPTVDFGCGVGHYAKMFEHYLGLDITAQLLTYAVASYPTKRFMLIDGIGMPPDIQYTPRLFFTATTLQHNPDDVVDDIIRSTVPYFGPGAIFSLYENTRVKAPHVFGREGEQYVAMLSEHYRLAKSTITTHSIHGELHTHTLAEVAE